MSEPLLQARDLSVERGGRRVLEGFGLAAHSSSISALAGPNGAGKSSALKALAGLLTSQGSLQLFGRDLRALSRRDALVVECNHDAQLLAGNLRYPAALKRRIAELEPDQCSPPLISPSGRRVWLPVVMNGGVRVVLAPL